MAEMKNKLTVCIPTLNRCDNLKKTLGNLLNSKLESISILVSDNGSNDGTWEYLKSINDNRLTISRNSENIGFTGNILKLLELSETDFVLFMSDEDFVLTDNLNTLISSNVFNNEIGIVYSGVLHSNNDTFYYKYNKRLWDKEKAMNKFILSHSYMSGMIFNKKYLDLDRFKNTTLSEDVVLYPHEIMAYMILCNGGKLYTESLSIVRQGEAEESEAITKYRYYEYKERLKLFNQYNRIVDKLDYGTLPSRIFYKKMSIIAACVFIDEVVAKKIKPREYLTELFSLNCGMLFKLQFMGYTIAVLGKRTLNQFKNK